jgi:hypothetical protein
MLPICEPNGTLSSTDGNKFGCTTGGQCSARREIINATTERGISLSEF